MAIGIANYPNIDTTDPANYPDGNIRDAAIGVPPTPVNVKTNGDIQMFFDKILRNAGITPSNTPDNEGNGYQLVKAATPSIIGTISVSTGSGVGGVTGTITYIKNPLANTLTLSGILTAANAQNFTGTPTRNTYLMGSLPVGFRPGTVFNSIPCFCIDASAPTTRFLDDGGVQYIDSISLFINSTGDISAGWIKPAITTTSYTAAFNAIISLH